MRIDEKIAEIELYTSQLKEIVPNNLEYYKNDFKVRAICERLFEKIIEAMVDLAFLVIKENKFKIPEEDTEAFDILLKRKVITEGLSKKLKEAKGMRNIIAHEYGKIDDEIVFNSITEELENDVREFIRLIKEKI